MEVALSLNIALTVGARCLPQPLHLRRRDGGWRRMGPGYRSQTCGGCTGLWNRCSFVHSCKGSGLTTRALSWLGDPAARRRRLDRES